MFQQKIKIRMKKNNLRFEDIYNIEIGNGKHTILE